MTIFTSRRFWSSVACAIALVVMFVPRAVAAPIVVPSVSTLPGGLFEYSYELQNSADSLENIFDFRLLFTDTETVTGLAAPTGWTFAPASPGLVNWFSGGESADLLPGASLRGFLFQSVLGPGTISFQTTGHPPPIIVEALADNPPIEGFTQGPVVIVLPPDPGPDPGPDPEPAPIPEPATMWLTGSSVVALVGWARRRRAARPE